MLKLDYNLVSWLDNKLAALELIVTAKAKVEAAAAAVSIEEPVVVMVL